MFSFLLSTTYSIKTTMCYFKGHPQLRNFRLALLLNENVVLLWAYNIRPKILFWPVCLIESIFFNWLFIIALTARSYRDYHWFSVWEWYFYWYFEPQQSHMRFFLIHADIYRVVSKVVSGQRPTWTTMSSGNPMCHERHLSGRVQCSHRATSDEINHEIRQPHLWVTVWVHITLPSVEELEL